MFLSDLSVKSIAGECFFRNQILNFPDIKFAFDLGYRCVFAIEGNVYKLHFVGTHKLIDRF